MRYSLDKGSKLINRMVNDCEKQNAPRRRKVNWSVKPHCYRLEDSLSDLVDNAVSGGLAKSSFDLNMMVKE